MYENGQIPMKTDSPSYRDSVQVPSAGYLVARFFSDNPGKYIYRSCRLVPVLLPNHCSDIKSKNLFILRVVYR